MMNYKKSKNIEEELTEKNIPIECLPEHFLWMHVKGGTTVSNVVDYAKRAIDSGEHKCIVWTGSGGGITKTISCAEIMKRGYEMHQVTRFAYKKVEEYWDPIIDGLEQIVAKRQIPCIHILLSLDEIDPTTPGYQHSKAKSKFLDESQKPSSTRKSHNHQRPGRSGGASGNKPKSHNSNRKSKQKFTKSEMPQSGQ